MDLKDIGRLNPGEELLVEISNALNAGEQPSDEAVQKLNLAVAAMLGEEDAEMRLNELHRKLGLFNPEGRPPLEKRAAELEQGKRMARSYWWYRFQGCKKGEAAKKAAGEFQRSGEFKEGSPRSHTVRANAKRFPEQAKSPFYNWRLLRFESDKDQEQGVVEEVKRYLSKNQIKTS